MKLAVIERVEVAEFFTVVQTLSERTWLLDHAPIGKGYRRRAGEPSMITLFGDLAAIMRSYFLDLSWAYKYPRDIEAVLRIVRPNRDAVIDFNWDEEVDIWFSSGNDEDVAYTLGAWGAVRETLVLKPHGSIGWYDLRHGIGNEDGYLIARGDDRIARHDKRLIAYMGNELPFDIDRRTPYSALACPPVITAPTFSKRFDYVEQQRIWQDVLEVCQNAREFVFLGYSLPKDDFLTRAAIRAARSQNQTDEPIRCLVVDQSFDDAKHLNFMSVFGGLSPDRNYLQWQFGSRDNSLGRKVQQKLARAFVGPV